jgi:inner membrane transporter RhtA
VLAGIVSVQLGASFAKDVFDEVSPTGMVWLRMATAAVVVGLVARPALRGRSRADWYVAVAFGVNLGFMNWAFYQAMSRIPIGIAVTIEFIGPLTLAVVLSRRARDLVWVLLAGVGVVLLGVQPGDVNLAGVVFALLAGASWAAYFLLSVRTGIRWPGLDGLAVAGIVAAVLLAPFALVGSGPDLLDPRIIALGAVVGMLSSVVPYSFELIALRTIKPAVFSILMSLEPAAAALTAMLVLEEFLTAWQWLALACVVAASVGATRSGAVLAEPVPD